jgi:thioester reductase-like protein
MNAKSTVRSIIYRLGLLTGDSKNGVMKNKDLFKSVLQWIKSTKTIPNSLNLAVDITPVGIR